MLTIRPATISDTPLLAALIREFAEFERELEHVSITPDELARDGFGANPKFRALIAEVDSQVAGYAVFFTVYSTWRGSQLFLEDVFIRPKFRSKGFGKQILSHLAQLARNENCHAMRWEVLDWNQPAIDFYRSLGADFLDKWRQVLLKDESLHRLADQAK